MINKKVIIERKRQLLKDRFSNPKAEEETTPRIIFENTSPARNQSSQNVSLVEQPLEPVVTKA